MTMSCADAAICAQVTALLTVDNFVVDKYT